jgi:hypothetical protein
MRENIRYEAYKATVVLLALLDTLWSNTNAMSKVLRNGVYGELAKKFSHQYSQAKQLQADAQALEVDAEDFPELPPTQHAKVILRVARKMNREARVVARFHDIPTKDMYASDLVRRMG